MAEQPTTDRNGGTPLGTDAFTRLGRRPATDAAAEGLHVCPECASKLVYPTDWAPVDRLAWHVDLRCPDCEWQDGGVYPQEVVDRFDDELDRGTDQLIGDLGLLTRSNMEEQIEHFVTALESGWILPEDF